MLSDFSLSKHFRFLRTFMQPKSNKTLWVIKNKPTCFHWWLFLKSTIIFFCSICNPAIPIPRAYKSNQPDYCVLTQFCSVSLCRTSPSSSFISSSPFSPLHPPSLSFTAPQAAAAASGPFSRSGTVEGKRGAHPAMKTHHFLQTFMFVNVTDGL